MSLAYRAQRRNYGIGVPADEVEVHIANGWELIEDVGPESGNWRGDILMRPPAIERERAA